MTKFGYSFPTFPRPAGKQTHTFTFHSFALPAAFTHPNCNFFLSMWPLPFTFLLGLFLFSLFFGEQSLQLIPLCVQRLDF